MSRGTQSLEETVVRLAGRDNPDMATETFVLSPKGEQTPAKDGSPGIAESV
jgi:hypothetical protein